MSDLQPPTSQTIKIKPIINYPREAQTGQTYLMTIDLQLASPDTLWPYPEEEYPITFILNTQPYFYYESLDEGREPGVILHRFGGTYGPATYLLTATEQVVEPGHISITFMNKWGIPVTHMELDCAVKNRFEKDIKPEVIIEHKNVISVPEERATEDTGSYAPKEENTQNAGKEKTSKELIAEQLMQTGWDILDGNRARPSTSQGVAVANYPTFPDDYLLYIGSRPIGIVKVSQVGEPLAGSEEPVPALPIPHSLAASQEPTSPATYGSARYGVSRYEGIEESYPILPFVYETTGIETRFTSFLEPEPRSRALFTFHRPETLAHWLQQAPPNIPTTRNNLLRSRLQKMPQLQRKGLYPHQFEAISNLEHSLASNHALSLIQMVVNTGMTYTVAHSIYRLLRHGGARRILYVFASTIEIEYTLGVLKTFIPPDEEISLSDLYSIHHLQNSIPEQNVVICITTFEQLYSTYHLASDDQAGSRTSNSLMIRYNPTMPIEEFDVIFIGNCNIQTYYRWRPLIEYFDAFIIGIGYEIDHNLRGIFANNVVYEQKASLPRALILTALAVEYQAVRSCLTALREEALPIGTIYEQGNFEADDYLWDVIIIEHGQGNVEIAVETERAINYLNPDIVLSIGLAGGLKDVQIGDVVVATKVYGYESGKADATFRPRPQVFTSTFRIAQLARLLTEKNDWLRRVKGQTSSVPAPHVLIAPIAAGEKVITSINSQAYRLLRSTFADAIASDMESIGLLTAIHGHPQIESLIVRGISDVIGDSSKHDGSQTQIIAAQNASAFAFEMLSKLKPIEISHQEDRNLSSNISLPIPVFYFNVAHLPNAGELYGRKRERMSLLERTRKGNSTSIVGRRRIGKTWLLDYLKLVAPTELATSFRIASLDGTTTHRKTVSTFVTQALNALGIPLVSNSAELEMDMLTKAIEKLQSQHISPVLCIDEFEGFFNQQDFDGDFFAGLRYLAANGLVLVTASKIPLIDLLGERIQTSPFFNIFEQITLKPFNELEAEEFVQAKSRQASFNNYERAVLLKYGQVNKQEWPPLRLQLVGEKLMEDKNLAAQGHPEYYRPGKQDYWHEFEGRLEETYRGAVH